MATSEPPDEPAVARLKEQQRDQELVEREQLSGSDTEADADRHLRRADKARYLREKLEERERADRQAAEGDE